MASATCGNPSAPPSPVAAAAADSQLRPTHASNQGKRTEGRRDADGGAHTPATALTSLPPSLSPSLSPYCRDYGSRRRKRRAATSNTGRRIDSLLQEDFEAHNFLKQIQTKLLVQIKRVPHWTPRDLFVPLHYHLGGSHWYHFCR